jgi:hypothetical protein
MDQIKFIMHFVKDSIQTGTLPVYCVGWDAREIIIFMIGVRERVLKNSFHAVETCLINMFHYKFRFMYA